MPEQPLSERIMSEELAALRLENKCLRERIQLLLRERFGASSEELDRAQLLLKLQGLEALGKSSELVAAEAPRRSQDRLPPRKRRPRAPEDLPIIEEVIVPEPVKACPGAWRQIGEEVTVLLDYEPARFFKRRVVRPKYARRDHPYAAPIIAPLQTLQDRCVAAPGLIAAIVTGKYCDHLPLYRQEQIFASRHDVHLPRQRMAQWMHSRRTGSNRFTARCAKRSSRPVMCRSTKRRSNIWRRVTARRSLATFGRARAPAQTRSSTGKPVAQPSVWTACCLQSGPAPSSAMVTPPIRPLLANAARTSASPDVGRMRVAPFTRRNRVLHARAPGCSTRSASSTPSNVNCELAELVLDCAPPFEVAGVHRSSGGSMLPS